MKYERPITWLLALALVVLLVLQFRSLYVFPVYDSARWWGDEFGQVIELKTEIEEGVARIPTGYGATVAETNGIVRANSWLAAAFYGLPAVLFFPTFDLVTIGRTVTALLSVVLIVCLFWSLRSSGSTSVFAFAILLLLVTNRAFLFATHSARLDVAAGFAVLAWLSYIIRASAEGRSYRWWFLLGAVTFLLCTLSIHLLTLLGPVAIFAVWRLGGFRRPLRALSAVLGVLLCVGILLGTYALTSAPFTLFGETGPGTLQAQEVVAAFPGLRPFSFSVQSSNIIQRFELLIEDAPIFVLPFTLAMVAIAVIVPAFARKLNLSEYTIRLLGSTGIITWSWLEFQSSSAYYLLHLLPLLAFAIGAIVHRAFETSRAISVIGFLVLALLYFSNIQDSIKAEVNGAQMSTENRAAIQAVIPRIDPKAKILTQIPAISLVHESLDRRMMTTHFVNFPKADQAHSDLLVDHDVRYILEYRTSRMPNFSFESATLNNLAALGTIDTQFIGRFFDVRQSYFHPLHGSDTLTLYRLWDHD